MDNCRSQFKEMFLWKFQQLKKKQLKQFTCIKLFLLLKNNCSEVTQQYTLLWTEEIF